MFHIHPHTLLPKHVVLATVTQMHSYNVIKHFPMMLLCALCLARPTMLVAQWEHMDRFYATNIVSYAANDTRIVAMLLNGELYTSNLDSIDWKLMDVLPVHISTASYRTLHFGPNNTLYVSTQTDVFRYNEAQRNWTSLSENLALRSFDKITDVAIESDNILYVAEYSGPLHRSTDGGRSWSQTEADLPVWYGNHLQLSPEGTLYVNTRSGLYYSRTKGLILSPVGTTGPFINFDPLGSYDGIIVVNDTTIWGCDDRSDIYTYDPAIRDWKLIRTNDPFREYDARIGVGRDGTLFYIYNKHAMFTSEDEGATVEWSSDRGASWSRITTSWPDVGYDLQLREYMYGDSGRFVGFERWFLGGEVYETNLRTRLTTRRAAPIARSHSYSIFSNRNWLGVSSLFYRYFYNKKSDSVVAIPMGELVNIVFRDSNAMYARTRNSVDDAGMIVFYDDVFSRIKWSTSCWVHTFVLSNEGHIISAFEGEGVSRWGSRCSQGMFYSPFLEAVYTAINSRDQYIAVGRKGEFEYRDSTNILLSKGQLAPFVDSVRAVQNDTRGNIVMLGVRDAYYSSDYGAQWQRSSLDNNGAGMTTVIVDRNDHFYVLDENNTVYWSADAGASFTPFPVDLDSLFCGVTDIEVDEEYLYAGTSGCGVFRRALPSINSIEQLRPVARRHEAVNLALAAGQPLRIDAPFALDERTLFRLSDINGRVLQQVTFTVNRHHACILAQLPSLPGGVYTYALASSTDVLTGKIIIGK